MLGIIEAARKHASRRAILEGEQEYTYDTLLKASSQFAALLLQGSKDLGEQCIAFMVDPGFDYVKVQWAIWRSGGIAVPLCLTHPLPSLQYVLEDTAANVLVVSPQYAPMLEEYAKEKSIRLLVVGDVEGVEEVALSDIDTERAAMILYTSGTTNKPKGVVLTHANLESQINTLVQAWEWRGTDHILCVLPLHHVHGIVNVVCCSLWSGATLEFIPSFSAEHIFSLFLKGQINVFMAVPTIYFKLIASWEVLPEAEKNTLTAAMSAFRLMVCGSAALPVSVMENWKRISGHVLLERYGMTEIGMAISNPLHGERRAGFVGIPLPGVGVRIVNEQYEGVPVGEPGEILVKGKNVFREYWGKPEATQKEFTSDGWFKTGDVAVVEDGYIRIMGRTSVDIIKSGGYKISALEIEEVLRTHDKISDCAVVGIPNDEWGELIVAALVVKEEVDQAALDPWLRERIPSYKTPRKYIVLSELPRNAMGKVVKAEVKKLFQ